MIFNKMFKNISNKNKKVFVGLSGGVDSSVSAFLLKESGYDVVGVFIKTWQPDYIECTWREDRLDAMRVCAELDIPFMTLDLEKEYKQHVIDYFLEEYNNNRVPNPDIMCNKYIKFGAFIDFALKNDADYIATGHYASINKDDFLNYFLEIPKDKNKDQTYFLYQIDKKVLDKIIFPLANLEKNEVREIAKSNSLWVADKKDSQGICMLGGDISPKDFLIRELKPESGNVCNELGEVIGHHDGVILYTIGERHGFNVIKKGIDSKPYFVYRKDFVNNILYVTNDESLNLKNNSEIILKDINLFKEINEDKAYNLMTRYRGEKNQIKLKLDKQNNQIQIINYNNLKIQAVSGQSGVLYEGDVLIGGGIIS